MAGIVAQWLRTGDRDCPFASPYTGSVRLLPTRVVLSFSFLALLVPLGAAGLATVQDPTASPVAPGYRTDALVIQLTAEALQRALARQRASAAAVRPMRVDRLGFHQLDTILSSMPGAYMEPEFRGETTPPLGSGKIDFSSFWIVHLPVGTKNAVESVAQMLRGASEIARVERITILPVEAVPNDSLWSKAYYFYQASRRDTHAPEAWDITRGDTSIVVAIVDTGMLPYHPDLEGHLWTNWTEEAGVPGVDDDGNGFVDDIHGWDFVDLPSDQNVQPGEDGLVQDNDPNDFSGHGTAVAGVIGAQTDNVIGVAGVVWHTRLMPLRAGWSSLAAAIGEVDMTFAAQAIRYATRMHASVINCSFASVYQFDLEAAVNDAVQAGITIVSPAGNNNNPSHYLADREDVISVAATDENDQITRFSNRGTTVDLAAPGLNIATTSLAHAGADSLGRRQPTYTLYANGTSFSAALVSGAAALLQSQRLAHGQPPLSPIEAQLRLVETADDIAAANPGGSGYGSGRLNILRALTDPPPSLVAREHGVTVGPPVVLPTASGLQRFAVVTSDGRLLVIDGATEETFASVRLSAPPQGGLAAADLGGGRGVGMFVATTDGLISGFDGTGHMLPGWPVTATTSYHVPSAEPVLGDLDGDGILEVVWGGDDGNVWAWRADGSRVPAFPRYLGGLERSLLIALSDLDGRPGTEIIATTYSSNYAVCALRGDGSMLPNWPRQLRFVPSAPVVTRLGHDPRPVVIVGAGYTVSAFDVDGTKRWEKSPGRFLLESPAVADLDGDGSDEIILPCDNVIAVLDSSGDSGASPNWLTALPGMVLGPAVVGPLGLQGAPGVLQLVTGNQLFAFDSSGVMMPGFPKYRGASVVPTLADLDQDGRTDIIAGSGIDSLIRIYVAGPGSWRAGTDPGWPTARGNFARTGSRLYAPPMAILDDVPPVAVTDLAAPEVTASTAVITWTAPADVGANGRASRYELRRASTPLTPESFASGELIFGVPSPGEPGTHERVIVSGLAESATYYFAIRSYDSAGNLSVISNGVRVSTAAWIPAPVIDLRAMGGTDTSIVLRWTATGDDGTQGRPRVYLLRASQHPLDDASFDEAPIAWENLATVDAGHSESSVLRGVKRGERYWIALKAVDHAGNQSLLSNVVTARVGAPRGNVLTLVARAQPARSPVEIEWESPGAAGRAQEIRIYDVVGRLRRLFSLGTDDFGIVAWDGCDSEGRQLASGVYLARLVSGGRHAQSRIILLR